MLGGLPGKILLLMEDTLFTKNIFIVGAGGLGREIAGWIDTSDLSDKFKISGFLDDNLNQLDKYHPTYKYKIEDKVTKDSLIKAKNIVLAIANSEVKDKIYTWREKTLRFSIVSLIYPNTTIGSDCNLDEGLITSPNTVISSNTSIEKGVFINCGSQIGHDVKIGKYSNIMAGVNIGGETIIGNNVFIGTGAIILPRIKICDNARIGSGAVVIKSIKQPGTYFGNPASRIF